MSTTFPNATQSFKTWQDLTSAQLNAYVQYINYLNQGDWTAARNVFEQGGLSPNMLPTAADFNAMCDTILECQALYEAPTTSAQGIQDFMGQFTYRGTWSSSYISQYKKFTLVKYNGVVYLAAQDITTTTDPATNSALSNPQWLKIAPVTATNVTTAFTGQYVGGTTYAAGDVVIYNNKFYVAIDSTSSTPIDTSHWAMLFDMNPYISVISTTRPSDIITGTIWFQEIPT